MKRFYIKLLILVLFSSFTNLQTFADEGIDIAELKKIKNVKSLFKRSPKKEKKKVDFKEVPYDDNPISDITPDYDADMMSDNFDSSVVKQ
ncbi:MAG: hypothetical protein IJ877_06150, partial [Candidatus Gastranaerophilales bacterium]|nr:hypothetical protein [Candidatus Gastranaerophilales bacterium]